LNNCNATSNGLCLRDRYSIHAIKEKHEITMARSIRILNTKTGMVIFVGRAARFVTSVIPIAAIASTNKYKLFPVNITAITVSGVRIQPCAASIIPSHNNLDSSSLLHHAMNLVSKEGAEVFCV